MSNQPTLVESLKFESSSKHYFTLLIPVGVAIYYGYINNWDVSYGILVIMIILEILLLMHFYKSVSGIEFLENQIRIERFLVANSLTVNYTDVAKAIHIPGGHMSQPLVKITTRTNKTFKFDCSETKSIKLFLYLKSKGIETGYIGGPPAENIVNEFKASFENEKIEYNNGEQL